METSRSDHSQSGEELSEEEIVAVAAALLISRFEAAGRYGKISETLARNEEDSENG